MITLATGPGPSSPSGPTRPSPARPGGPPPPPPPKPGKAAGPRRLWLRVLLAVAVVLVVLAVDVSREPPGPNGWRITGGAR